MKEGKREEERRGGREKERTELNHQFQGSNGFRNWLPGDGKEPRFPVTAFCALCLETPANGDRILRAVWCGLIRRVWGFSGTLHERFCPSHTGGHAQGSAVRLGITGSPWPFHQSSQLTACHSMAQTNQCVERKSPQTTQQNQRSITVLAGAQSTP